MDTWMADVLAGLREGQAGDLAGSRASLDLSVSESLINRAILSRLPHVGPVKHVSVRPLPGRARVTVRLAGPWFLPPLSVGVTVERQPDLPASPDLILRLELPAGLGRLLGVGASVFAALPPGLRLDGNRLHVDLATLLARHDLAWALHHARWLVVTFEEGRVRIQGSAAVE
jgi:hypothetical protein